MSLLQGRDSTIDFRSTTSKARGHCLGPKNDIGPSSNYSRPREPDEGSGPTPMDHRIEGRTQRVMETETY